MEIILKFKRSYIILINLFRAESKSSGTNESHNFKHDIQEFREDVGRLQHATKEQLESTEVTIDKLRSKMDQLDARSNKIIKNSKNVRLLLIIYESFQHEYRSTKHLIG